MEEKRSIANSTFRKDTIRRSTIIALFLTTIGLSSCQHVRVQTAWEIPASCTMANALAGEKCKQDLEEQKRTILASNRITTHVIQQSFYLMGLYPLEQRIQLHDYCPGETLLEAYQYSTWKQGLFEQLTLGIWSPRTLIIKCVKPEKVAGSINDSTYPTGKKNEIIIDT